MVVLPFGHLYNNAKANFWTKDMGQIMVLFNDYLICVFMSASCPTSLLEWNFYLKLCYH